MASSEINSSSSSTISSPQRELQIQQTNLFVRNSHSEHSPPLQTCMSFRDLLREYRSSTSRYSEPSPPLQTCMSFRDLLREYRSSTSRYSEPSPPLQTCMSFRDLLREYRSSTSRYSEPSAPTDNWWEVEEATESDDFSSVGSSIESSTTASTTSTKYTSSWEQLVDGASELSLDDPNSEGDVYSDYSGSEYSDDNDDRSDSSFSDDDDDEFFNATPSPSSYADLFNMCLDGPEPTKKRYRSGWWENVGSRRTVFPISYTNYENSDRLPSLPEEPGDDDETPEAS